MKRSNLLMNLKEFARKKPFLSLIILSEVLFVRPVWTLVNLADILMVLEKI